MKKVFLVIGLLALISLPFSGCNQNSPQLALILAMAFVFGLMHAMEIQEQKMEGTYKKKRHEDSIRSV